MKKYKNNLWSCIKNYRFHSIFIKNMVLILCVLIIPFICVIMISYYAYNQIQRSEKKAYTEEMITRVTKDVESMLVEFRNKAILLGYDSDLELFYRAESIEDDKFYDARHIFDLLAFAKISTEVIDSVYVYAPYSQTVISPAGRYAYEQFEDRVCIDRWQNTGEMYQFEYLEREIAGKKKDNISFYYTIQYGKDRAGVVIINISIDKLKKTLDYGEEINLAMIGNGQVLYDSSMQQNGSRVENLDEFMRSSQEELVVSSRLEQFDLENIIYINSQSLFAELGKIRLFIVVFIVIILFISIGLVFHISLKIFDPFNEIMHILDDESMMNEKRFFQNKDEMGYIQNSIYATISRNKDIEEELLKRITLLKKAQAVALQSQINPHFMNNTLEAINWSAVRYLGNKNEVSDMLNCLSQLMRISLDNSDTFVTLSEEITYVEKYLFIQQKRLNENFDVIWNIPEEVQRCKVIKMLLQPIIENAINYGIKPYRKKGELCICAARKDERICISVKDSGLGIPKEEVDEINQNIRKEFIKESNHIGLSNVNQRIMLAFGEEYGVTIESRIGIGTIVNLEMPYQV